MTCAGRIVMFLTPRGVTRRARSDPSWTLLVGNGAARFGRDDDETTPDFCSGGRSRIRLAGVLRVGQRRATGICEHLARSDRGVVVDQPRGSGLGRAGGRRLERQ